MVLARRGAQGLGVAILVSVLCFLVVRRLPGDAAYRIAAGRYGYDLVDQEAADAVRAELGLDRPAWRQLVDWLLDVFQLDFGRSLVTSRPVLEEVGYYSSAHFSWPPWRSPSPSHSGPQPACWRRDAPVG